MRLYIFACVLFVAFSQTISQLPPRLSIPGALLVSSPPRPRQRIQFSEPGAVPIRIRKPYPNASPAPVREAVRPVVEEPEDIPEQEISSNFDDEVAKLRISNLPSNVQQAINEENVDEEPAPQRAVQFRPERPLPVLRTDIRDQAPRPAPPARPPPIAGARPAPIYRENIRPPVRQEIPEEPLPVRRPAPQPKVRPVPVQQAPQQFRQPARGNPPQRQQQQAPQYLDNEERRPVRGRKPPVQILRKYRTDNADGSITWGYENDDGTFKEETIGNDCITRGKYGYFDPDGVKREYTYETGGRCEDPEEELAQLPQEQPQSRNQIQSKGPNKIYRLPA